jgi:DNA-binding NtrC family response regulator
MDNKPKIMIVDDDENIIHAFMIMFEKDGYVGISAKDGLSAIKIIEKENPSVIFMDITMPELSGLEVLNQIRKKNFDIPVIVITGFGTMQTAIKATQLGAYEYITKPLDIEKIRVTLKRALETVSLKKEIKNLKVGIEYNERKYELIGNSLIMQEIYKTIGSVASMPNLATILIVGETGTGKELTARAIHNSGENVNEPFVAVNCSAFPETLLESEIFGHEKGAFTSAIDKKIGKFELAKSGTIFLDEIGNLSLQLQQKFLRVLQEREFERLGGNEIIRIKARFITATNRNLEEEVARGNFREDLFFRLNVVLIKLPPLRERKDDIPILANYFLNKYNYELKKNIKLISDEVMKILIDYNYPGNVRELENIIERCVILEKGNVILLESLPDSMKKEKNIYNFEIPITSAVLKKARKDILETFEKKFVIERLKANNGNVTKSANEAKIERQSFQRLMKKYGISSEDFKDK